MGRVIVLPHPGGEHLVDNPKYYSFSVGSLLTSSTGTMPWNDAEKHRRKFLCSVGDYVDSNNELHENEEINFWGEWEQESDFVKTGNTLPGNPKYVHTPKCVRTSITSHIISGKAITPAFMTDCKKYYGGRKQNTDPYVFGDSFKYSCCRQKGQLLGLNPGDVILFISGWGRKPNRVWVLDTVFVVGGNLTGGKINYESNLNSLKSLVTPQYFTGVILPICFGNGCALTSTSTNVLYYGASYSEKQDGMYSFFPCKLSPSTGFSRYILYDEKSGLGLGRDYSIQNYSFDDRKSSEDFWNELKKDILNKGYLLGTKAYEPPYMP